MTTARRPIVERTAPGLLGVYGVGYDVAAKLLVAAGDNPDRLRSEAAFAHLCGVAPLPASSGKTRRHRLNRGGNRQANNALYRIVITRMSSHTAPSDYVARRRAEGTSTGEIVRILKRYVAREVFKHLRPTRDDPRRGRSAVNGRRNRAPQSPHSRATGSPGITSAADPVSPTHHRHRRQGGAEPSGIEATVAV